LINDLYWPFDLLPECIAFCWSSKIRTLLVFPECCLGLKPLGAVLFIRSDEVTEFWCEFSLDG
jgi:hypothetical protein